MTRTFSVPTPGGAGRRFLRVRRDLRPGDDRSDHWRVHAVRGNRIPTDRIDPLAMAFLQRVPQPTSAAPLQNLTSVGKQIKDVDQISLQRRPSVSRRRPAVCAFQHVRCRRSPAVRDQRLQETLVPGFGRDGWHEGPKPGRQSHASVRPLDPQRAALWMDARHRWTGQRESRRRFRAPGRSAGGHDRIPAMSAFPRSPRAGLYSTFGDPTSFVYRDNQHFELYDNVMFDRGAHRLKFGGYYFHLQFRPEQPDNARGAFTYTGTIQRERVCRLPARATRHRPWPASDAATRTGARNGCICSRRTTGGFGAISRSISACATNTTSTCATRTTGSRRWTTSPQAAAS